MPPVRIDVQWHNNGEHRHSAIQFITPNQCHAGNGKEILENRKTIYKAAKERNPKRWSGEIRNRSPVTKVWLNPLKEVRSKEQKLCKVA
jgi:putative transposase